MLFFFFEDIRRINLNKSTKELQGAHPWFSGDFGMVSRSGIMVVIFGDLFCEGGGVGGWGGGCL